MNAPIIAWTNKDLIILGDAAHPEVPNVIQFNDGVFNNPILAGTPSVETTFYITNNFKKGVAATEDCFDMKNCSLTVKNQEDGSMNGQLIQEKWVNLKCDSKGESVFTPVGAHLNGATWEEDALAIGCGDATIGVNNISGLINDGDETGTGKNNVVKLTAKCLPSLNASAGKHAFNFRLVYTYGTGV